MATAIQILVILLVLFNFFVLYMCAKRWRIVHVLVTFLVFASALAFVFFASVSLKNRLSWLNMVKLREKELADAQKLHDEIKVGDPDKNQAPETSLTGAKGALAQEQYDRGRIWPNCVPGRFDPRAGTITVETSVADPAVATGPPKENRITDRTILYAFKEVDTPAGFKLPVIFLGEFAATGVTPTSVTLAPTLPLDAVQAAAVGTPDSTWVLYEVMPVDRHEQSFDDTAEKKRLTRDQVKVMLGTDEKKLLDEYQYDQLPVREIEALDKDFADSLAARPADVWIRVKFLKPYSVDVDSNEAPAADKTLFDSSGRALPTSLRQGDKTSFEVGDFANFDRDTATQLVGDGTCDKVDEIFVRPLHNYEQHFHDIDKRFKTIAEHLAVKQVDLANTKTANAAAKVQVDYRQKEKDNATSDLKQVAFELAEVTKYRQNLEAAIAAKRAELSEMYRTNNALVAELAAIQKKIADDLNKPAAEPAPESTSTPAND